MFKKILGFLIAFVFLIALVACEPSENKPGEQGDNPEPPTEIDYDNYEYKTPQTESLKLTAEWEGKNFITDGIGEVKVSQYVDGDTAIVRCVQGGSTFTIRFNGVNTPESTYKVEPWGFAASKYTKSQLKKASKIVLSTEDMNSRVDSTGKRYLAWVWLIDENGDSKLLNLELCELAYGYAKANATSLAEYFSDAVYRVSIDKCRIYGQKDPDYDYSTEAQAMSLKQIRETYGSEEQLLKQEKKGARVVVSGVVTRMNGVTSCYIQQYDDETNDYYGVYVYGGFATHSEFAVGNSVVIEGKIGYYYGSLQITDVSSIKLRAWADSANPEATIVKKEIEDNSVITIHNTLLFGRIVTVHNLKVVGGSDADGDSNAFTIRCTYEDGEGQSVRLDVRVDANILLKDASGERITSYQYFSGKTFKDLTAIVSYYDFDGGESGSYDGYVQLMLTQDKDYQFA